MSCCAHCGYVQILKCLLTFEARRLYSEHLQFIFRTFTVYIQNIYSLYSEHLQFIFRTFTVYIQNIYSLYSEHLQFIFRTFTSSVSACQNTHCALQALETTRLVHQLNVRSYNTYKPCAQKAGLWSADTHATYSYQCLHLRHPIFCGCNRYIKYQFKIFLLMSDEE